MQRLVGDDGKGGDAAQRRGYSVLTSWFPGSFDLGSSLRRDTATSTRDACATQIRVHSCAFVVRVVKRIIWRFTGGCVCGGTRYVLKSRPVAGADCHCIDCRRSAGAPYVTWGAVPREDLVVTKGEPRKITHATRIRSFAACCGTHLFIEDTTDSDTIDVTIASLDDPDAVCASESDLARR